MTRIPVLNRYASVPLALGAGLAVWANRPWLALAAWVAAWTITFVAASHRVATSEGAV